MIIRRLLNREFASHNYKYDLMVIGGGSGGIACATEAVKYNKKVCLADYVDPSNMGSTWGLGGTCPNVGCIPKKLMHYSASFGENKNHISSGGWDVATAMKDHNWEKLVENVQMHLHSLNWGAKSKLKKNNVTYANAKAILKDKNTVELKSANGSTIETAENIVIATGCRPSFGNIKGAKECCITSDDMFSRKKPFGDTLVVGGSYVALECAGVIRGFNKKVTIMSNGKILSNFDKDMALTVRSHLLHSGIAIKEGISPLEMSKTKDGKIQVLTKPLDMVTHTQEFDDVLLAIGRSPCTSNIGLENVGVQLAKDGKILTNSEEQTNISNIYALGDVAYNRIMLTPVAGKAGRLLARRLYGKSIELMDYNLIPTALFTPVEYGSCGLTEEQAIEKNGTDITVYHTKFTPLEWHIDPEEERPPCHIKIICEKSTDRIIGFHIVAPNAGEITQGFAAAMKCGISKSVLDSTMGIHPTIAEDCIGILTTKENNANPVKGSC